jgi:hypothetical protein
MEAQVRFPQTSACLILGMAFSLSFSPSFLSSQTKSHLDGFIGHSLGGVISPQGPTKAGVQSGIPLLPPGIQKNDSRPQLPPLPQGPYRFSSPGAPTPPSGSGQPHPNAYIRVFKNTQVTPTGATRSSVGEPTVAHHGYTALYTGNWYAALSKNDGSSWSYINPYTKFPPIDGGFCCDQYTMYIPNGMITAWLLQYRYSSKTKKNTYRLAIAKHEINLRKGIFHYYDFNPQRFGMPSGYFLDFPHMAYSQNSLFMTANIFSGNGVYNSTVCWKMPLSELRAGLPVHYRYVRLSGRTWRLTYGAKQIMYWWQHRNSSSGYLFRWLDSSTTYQKYTINIGSWNWGSKGSMVAKDPKGRNWMARSDSRPLGAWVARGIIGVMWNAKQGGAYKYPYTRVIEIKESNRTVVRQSSVWSNSTAWAYPCAATNNRGHLGGMLSYGGGNYYPGTAAWVVDDLDTKFAPLANVIVAAGNNSPAAQVWGDYMSAGLHSWYQNTWVGSAMSTRNGSTNSNQTPRFIHFGRSRDAAPEPDLRPISVSTSRPILYHRIQYSFSTKVENLGLVDAPPSNNGFYFSKNSIITTSDTLVTSFNLPSIAVGNSQFFSTSAKVPVTSPSGIVWFGVYLDNTFFISEKNEKNNSMSIPVKCYGRPDLTVTSAFSPVAHFQAGSLVKVQFTVKNRGTASSAGSVTGIYLSSNSLISQGDTFLGSVFESPLAAGSSRSHSLWVRIPYATLTSTMYLGVIADCGETLSELYETNNWRSVSGKPAVSYKGNLRILEYLKPKYRNDSGPSSLTTATLDASKGGKAHFAVVAPSFKGNWYVLLLSGKSFFQFDTYTSMGLGLLNSSLLPFWLNKVPSKGIAYPFFNLPKTIIGSPFTVFIHSFWFDSSFKKVLGLGSNSISLRFIP